MRFFNSTNAWPLLNAMLIQTERRTNFILMERVPEGGESCTFGKDRCQATLCKETRREDHLDV